MIEGRMKLGGSKPETETPRPATTPGAQRTMRPDAAVEAVLSRTRITDVPTSFRCDDCGRHEPIMLLVVTPDPWEHPDVPPSRLKALCQTCYACTRTGEQLELAL